MATTGRPPFETFDVVEYSGLETRRLKPPGHLSPQARAAFIELVTGHDPRHFRPGDVAIMARYCEAVALAEQAARELATGGAVIDGKVSAWHRVHQDACKTIAALTLRLRLGPQSRQPRAHKTSISPVSYYEVLELEAQRDRAKPD
jgi:phage terminase small subunit